MNNFKNKTILITGGTGSFGSTFLKHSIKFKPKEVRVYSRDEKKQEDLRIQINNPIVKFYLGDTRDYQATKKVCKNVDFVFHAAALKQVPSCEHHPLEAIKTNILGSENVIQAAIENKVKKLVMLSTDKAVYPINAMGMSKALMEKLMLSNSRYLKKNETIICATRYGNVMASRGSIIPLILDQIKKNKKITVTDNEMTRFMMTLDESVDLVMTAFIKGNQGDILVQKSPATTIQTLVLAMKKIFNASNQVKIIGTRQGEKLFETLISREEMIRTENLKRYYRIRCDNRDLNYKPYVDKGNRLIQNIDEYNSHNTERLNLQNTIRLIKTLSIIKRNI